MHLMLPNPPSSLRAVNIKLLFLSVLNRRVMSSRLFHICRTEKLRCDVTATQNILFTICSFIDKCIKLFFTNTGYFFINTSQNYETAENLPR